MKTLITKAKQELKEIFLTWQGWAGWGVANVITSLHWLLPGIYAVITNNNSLYALSVSLFAFGMLPFVPLWLVNILIAVWIKNLLLNKKRAIVNKGV